MEELIINQINQSEKRDSNVSVIIPCYNQAQFLVDTLDSVLNQTYMNWECIIVNNGSTDNTEEIALKYCAEDKRVKYFYKTNGGLSSSRNMGLEKASGKYIQFLDADDKLHQEKLKVQVREMELNPKIDVFYSNFEFFYS